MSNQYNYKFDSLYARELFIKNIMDILSKQGFVTVVDVNDEVGLPSSFEDTKIGWDSLFGMTVTEDVLNCAYTFNLPEPTKLTKDRALRTNNKVELHAAICKELTDLYERKNHDYGDAFHDTFVEEGFAMARIRLTDKLKRFKSLTFGATEQMVKDESIRDTLIDLANYAIMTVMEMDRNAGRYLL